MLEAVLVIAAGLLWILAVAVVVAISVGNDWDAL